MANNWKKIKTEYITTEISYRQLAQKHGIGIRQICRVGKSEGWVEARKQYVNKVTAETIEKTADKSAKQLARVIELSDRLLNKIEQAIGELDMTLVTNTHKTKTIEYNNIDRPDKPTKETIDETEEVMSVQTIIDRLGLNKVTSALKDIKEIQMLRSELDKEEQEARISRLRSQTSSEGNDESDGIRLEVDYGDG